MGNTLPEPIREKESHEGTFGSKYKYAVADMQGWRLSMEDAYIVAPDLVEELPNTHFVGVFDGHGGCEVAKFCASHFHKNLIELQSFKEKNFAVALKECFHLMDNLIRLPENYIEITQYRGDALVRQFKQISRIIIEKRHNRFTLTQLQEVLNQANFFNVHLTIKGDLIAALEQLYQESSSPADGIKGAKPVPPPAPAKPKLDKPKKPAKLARMFSNSRLNRQKTKTKGKSTTEASATSSESPHKNLKPYKGSKAPKGVKDAQVPKEAPKPAFFMDTDSIAFTKSGRPTSSSSERSQNSNGKPKKTNHKSLPPGLAPPGFNSGAAAASPSKQVAKPMPPGGFGGEEEDKAPMKPSVERQGKGELDSALGSFESLNARSERVVESPEAQQEEKTSVVELEPPQQKEVLPTEALLPKIRASMNVNKKNTSTPNELAAAVDALEEEGLLDETSGADSNKAPEGPGVHRKAPKLVNAPTFGSATSEGFVGLGGEDEDEETKNAELDESNPENPKVYFTIRGAAQGANPPGLSKPPGFSSDSVDVNTLNASSAADEEETEFVGRSNEIVTENERITEPKIKKSKTRKGKHRSRSKKLRTDHLTDLENERIKAEQDIKSALTQGTSEKEEETKPNVGVPSKGRSRKTIYESTSEAYVNVEKKISDASLTEKKESVGEVSKNEPKSPQKKEKKKKDKKSRGKSSNNQLAPVAQPQVITPLPEGTFITAAGCTAVSALFYGDTLYVANIGDSRAVLSRNGHAIALSEDHKPNMPKERARIYAAGGTINKQGRINGDLNLSRCVGDLRFKTQKNLAPAEQIVTAEADVKEFKLNNNDQFVVFACDGIWDVLTNTQVVDFVLDQCTKGATSMTEIAEKLLDRSLSPDLLKSKGLGGDNMTCVIVALKPFEELQKFKPKTTTFTKLARGLFMSKDNRV